MKTARTFIDEIAPLIGVEQALDQVNYALKSAVRSLNANVVGALQVTCSDEAEREAAESFQRCFTQDLLPRLKHGQRAPFRTACLGGRYDWGSVRVAESNFAADLSDKDYKVMLVRINAHCAAHREHGTVTYGEMHRYGRASSACGALNGLLNGSSHLFAAKLREQFFSEGKDRVALLYEHVPEDVRMLYAALVSARLQARSAAVDAQDHQPVTPTLYVIVHAVSLNKPERDTELIGGVYVIDRRKSHRGDYYRGLGDDPTAYVMEEKHGIVHVSDPGMNEARKARNHRKLIPTARRKLPKNQQVEKLLKRAGDLRNADAHALRATAKTLLLLLADLSPAAAALLLFADGAAGAYNVYRVHRITNNIRADAEAHDLLMSIHDRLDHVPPERAREIIDVLGAGYQTK